MVMSCAVCGGSAVKVKETRIGRYRGEKVEVTSELFRCKDCGEGFFDPAQLKAHNRAIKDEIRKRDGLLPPEKIVEIRNNLGLKQPELEELLGTGEKVVSRWENGKVIQGSGHDNLLRLLEREPSMLEDLRQIQKLKLADRERYRKSHPRGMVAQAAY
jgi:HTH-type transcriptional regulator / antitoxin MqsA